MIEVKNGQTIEGKQVDFSIASPVSRVIDAAGLVVFPALIDPHVHFRVPGGEHKETWETGARAAIAGGVTTVFDMPNTQPASTTTELLAEKKELIDQQLRTVGIPLRYGLYLGADRRRLDEIGRVGKSAVGLKIYMGSSTGDLLMEDRESLDRAFCLAAKHNLLVAVHAEDERLIQINQRAHAQVVAPTIHSEIRSAAVAASAVGLAIELAQKYGTRLYVVHVSTQGELDLIRAAKQKGAPVFAEAAPHHLFLHTAAYQHLGTRALVNPPLRAPSDCAALWEAIADGTIDTIGTDHAPHTLEEKSRPYRQAPSGFPSIELYFPLLLNAYHEGKISLEKIVFLTHTRPKEIFHLPSHPDVVLVDLNKTKTISGKNLHTKAKWTPYEGWTLRGWPRYTIVNGHLFDLEAL